MDKANSAEQGTGVLGCGKEVAILNNMFKIDFDEKIQL